MENILVDFRNDPFVDRMISSQDSSIAFAFSNVFENILYDSVSHKDKDIKDIFENILELYNNDIRNYKKELYNDENIYEYNLNKFSFIVKICNVKYLLSEEISKKSEENNYDNDIQKENNNIFINIFQINNIDILIYNNYYNEEHRSYDRFNTSVKYIINENFLNEKHYIYNFSYYKNNDNSDIFSMTVLTKTEHPVHIKIEGLLGFAHNITLHSNDRNVIKHIKSNRNELLSSLEKSGVDIKHIRVDILPSTEVDDWRDRDPESEKERNDSEYLLQGDREGGRGQNNRRRHFEVAYLGFSPNGIEENILQDQDSLYTPPGTVGLNITA